MAGLNNYISTSNSEGTLGQACDLGGNASCAPECLVHPQFFCGQLLTDQDLNALLDWAKSKFRLSRYRLGWGVACGLQVTCDPNDASAVLVAPGYALDSCGNDVVLCKPDRLPLYEACRIPPTDCADPTAESAPQPAPSEFMGLPIPPGEARVVDIFVRYKAVPSNPLPALGRGACTAHEACEPSRTQEGYELYWRDANGTTYPQQSQLEAWERDYFSLCREVVDNVVEKAQSDYANNFESVKAELLSWVDRHPPQQFCFLRDAIAQLSNDSDLPRRLALLLAWMLMDCRLAYLSQGCASGDPEQGIPLARVVLRLQSGSRGCRVNYIDSASPYRRRLNGDQWPAPPGMFNLGQLVWQRTQTACAAIRDLGLDVREEGFDLPETPETLKTALDNEWPKDKSRTDLAAPRAGLFVDLSCTKAEYPSYEIIVKSADFATGAGNSVSRAVMFSLNEGSSNADSETEELQGEGVYIDQLTDIHGIGRERASILRRQGIRTFDQLAATSPEDIQKLFPRVKSEDIEKWLEEAKAFMKK